MRPFGLLSPKTPEEALEILAKLGNEGKVLAGGQDLLYRLKKRIAVSPPYLVNLKSIPGMSGIAWDERELRIGAMTTLSKLSVLTDLGPGLAVLVDAARSIATPEIRNLGTVGGNLCQDVWCLYLFEDYDCWMNGGNICYAAIGEHRYYFSANGGRYCIASHPSDLAPALIALEASAEVAGPYGRKLVPVRDLFQGFVFDDGRLKSNTLTAAEVITAVRIPLPAEAARGAYVKFRLRRSWDFALASAAVQLRFEGAICTKARVVLGGVGPAPMSAERAEAVLAGRSLTADAIQECCAAAAAGLRPLPLTDYKCALVRGLLSEALSSLK